MSRFLDSLDEAVVALIRRPLRSILTALGVMVGLGLYVASTTLAATAQADIRATFDRLRSRQIVVSGNLTVPDAETLLEMDRRVSASPGIEAAGLIGTVGRLPTGPSPRSRESVLVVTNGALDAVGAKLRGGRRFTPYEVTSGARVALIGSVLADTFTVGGAPPQHIILDGIPFRVVGEVDKVDRERSILLAVLIPPGPAFELWGGPGELEVVALATPDAADADVARRLPLVVDPTGLDSLEAATSPDASQLGIDIDRRLQELTSLLSFALLVAGVSVVAGATLVSALERRREFGIRRALGFSRFQIGTVVLAQATILTWAGGILGVSLTLMGVSIVGSARQWTLTIDWNAVFWATITALVAGPLAGLGPAIRAASVDPITAIRQ